MCFSRNSPTLRKWRKHYLLILRTSKLNSTRCPRIAKPLKGAYLCPCLQRLFVLNDGACFYRLGDSEARFKEIDTEFEAAREAAKAAKDAFSALKKRRCDLFNKAYTHISDRIDEVYKDLTKGTMAPMGGVAYLSLEDSEVHDFLLFLLVVHGEKLYVLMYLFQCCVGALSSWHQVPCYASNEAF